MQKGKHENLLNGKKKTDTSDIACEDVDAGINGCATV